MIGPFSQPRVVTDPGEGECAVNRQGTLNQPLMWKPLTQLDLTLSDHVALFEIGLRAS
jgi:hypothetical protein